MASNKWVKWYQYDSNGMKGYGQMPVAEIGNELKKFREEAAEVLKETGADHVVYGLKVYGEDGSIECVKFYMLPVSEEEFEKDVASLKNCVVYALHKH